MNKRSLNLLKMLGSRAVALLALALLVGCVSTPPSRNDPAYSPTYPAVPLPPAATNGSLFQPQFGVDLFSDRKAYRVGDIVTIVLEEATQAKKASDTAFNKGSSATIDPISIRGKQGTGLLDVRAGISGERAFAGDGKSNQSNSLKGNITVTVSDVLPNGVLLVRGEKWLTLNHGDEFIRVSGMVRSDDIDSDNTISSQKLADARISYSGTGALADANSPGWLSRLFNSPLFPF